MPEKVVAERYREWSLSKVDCWRSGSGSTVLRSKMLKISFCFCGLESKNGWPTRMKSALLEREDCNVVLVDWSKGAKFPYAQAAGNTRLVGAQTAELIMFLISSTYGTPDLAENFYIVGFSLGAVIAGYAGSYLKARGMMLGRITGRISAIFTLKSNGYH